MQNQFRIICPSFFRLASRKGCKGRKREGRFGVLHQRACESKRRKRLLLCLLRALCVRGAGGPALV